MMARASWLLVVVLAAGCQQKELDELKAKNAELEKQRADSTAQLAAAQRELAEAKAKAQAAASAGAAAAAAPVSDEQNMQEAQDAYVHGDYQKAIELAHHSVAKQPSRAWRVIGASQCFLKHKSDAHEAWAHLDGQGRQFLQYVCKRNGVAL